MTDDPTRRRSSLRIVRSKLSRVSSKNDDERRLLSEFASAIVSNDDLGMAFSIACEVCGMMGPDPRKLAIRMGATSLIDRVCSESGLHDPGIDPAGEELMKSNWRK